LPKELQWTRELINAFWDGVSQTPLTNLSFSRHSGSKLLEFVGHHLPPNSKCLDFGSGGGDLVTLLIERGCRAAAFEPSAERSKDVLDRPFADHPNFLGVVDDGSTQTFDVVIAAEVLEHVLDAELLGVVKRLRSFLKTGGTLIATTPNSEDLVSGLAYCPVSDLVFHRWQHLRSFTAETLDECLSAGGFRRIENHKVDYSSYADLMEERGEAERQIKRLKRKMRYARRYGPLYSLVAPMLRSRIEGDNQPAAPVNLRVGGETNLIYVGEAE
jgi:2-polyprenyl-3-methyl-5-hydroxy-6-metoxy-1,4-benzoquinol methylase